MTVQATRSAAAIDAIDLDQPIFDPGAFRLDGEQAAIIATARRLGQSVFAGRAAGYDREAKFPTENYRDLHRAGLLGIAIPKKQGGLGADYQTYALAAAEIGRYCGATALTWNMHVCSTLWSGPLTDDLDMDAATRAEHERRRAIHYRRIVDDGAIYSQPFSEGGAAAAGGVAFGTEAKPVKGGWLVNGKKIFARFPVTPTITACFAPRSRKARRPPAATRSILPCPPRPMAYRWSGIGIRWACAARSRARCCSRTCWCRRMPR